jgi:hypothetical protein
MGLDRARVLVLGLVSLSLIIASVLVMDWFVVRIGNLGRDMPFDRLTFDLRAIKVCASGVCASVELSQLPMLTRLGVYPSLAPATFWTSLCFAVIVGIQCGTRVVTGGAPLSWTRFGYFLGTLFLGVAAAVGYIFTPEVAPFTAARTAAPLLLILGYAIGMVALYFASSMETAADLIDDRSQAIAPARPSITQPPTAPIVQTDAPAVSRTRSRPIPPALRGKLMYTTMTAEITRAGLDARREDGSARLVLWRDVVGAVARRLPPEEPYAGTPFVDLVSTAGSTLRLLPWTRFSGEPLDGDGDGDARARALLALVIARCPDAQIDRATRTFVDGSDPPAQLPDEATLAQHDSRLA